jgi:hypothetical protein
MSYVCDGCGKRLKKGDLRYRVKIDVRAAYDTLEVGLIDLVRNHEEEIRQILESLESAAQQEVEDSIYKNIELDLCPSCQKAYIRQPLRFHPEQAPSGDEPFDIDSLLRSLGYGEGEEGD